MNFVILASIFFFNDEGEEVRGHEWRLEEDGLLLGRCKVLARCLRHVGPVFKN